MPPDHVLWCARGLQGVAKMLEELASDDVPPSSEAMLNLGQQIARLSAVGNKLAEKLARYESNKTTKS